MPNSVAAVRRPPTAVPPIREQAGQRACARLGVAAAVAVTGLGLAYLGLMAALALSGLGFPPPEPYATAISLITLLTAPGLVLVMSVVHERAPVERRAYSQAALAMTVIFATLTSINRYVQLTVIRQALAAGQTDGLELFMPYGWPSIMLALELLAWGGFLGVALILAGLAFWNAPGARGLAWLCLASGALCLCAGVGQVVQQDSLLWLGVAGWGPGLTLITALLAYRFSRSPVPFGEVA